MDAISTERLAAAHPLFIARANQLDVILTAQGIDFRWTNVVRTMAEQAADYAQGRTTPGAIITDAQPGQSWHEFGFAGDGCPMVNGEPDWNVDGANWPKVYAALPSVGLFSGKNFRTIPGDYDHTQLAEIPESPTDADVRMLTADGMQVVWAKYFPS